MERSALDLLLALFAAWTGGFYTGTMRERQKQKAAGQGSHEKKIKQSRKGG